MTAKQLQKAQDGKTQTDLRREIKWLKRHIKAREAVLAVKETKEGIK